MYCSGAPLIIYLVLLRAAISSFGPIPALKYRTEALVSLLCFHQVAFLCGLTFLFHFLPPVCNRCMWEYVTGESPV